MIAGRLGPIQRTLALAAIERAQVAAGERSPDHAVAVDVRAADPEAGQRHVVHLGQGGLHGVVARFDPDDRAGVRPVRSPDGIVGRVRHHGVEARNDPRVHLRIHRGTGLHVRVPPAVAVGIENPGRPALGGLGVAGFEEHLPVEPADHLAAAAGPQRVVLVIGELQMVRGVARVDEGVLTRLGVVHGELPVRTTRREGLGRGVIRAFLAEGAVVRRADPGRVPDESFLVEHRVVGVRLAVPDALGAPVSRGLHHVARERRVLIPHRGKERRRRVRHGIENREIVRGVLGRAVDQTVAVHRRIPPVRRDQVVEVRLRVGPVSDRRHDVALEALGPLGDERRQLAVFDALGPVGVVLERNALEVRELAHHVAASLAGLHAANPGLLVVVELTQCFGDDARRVVAHLMAADAAVVGHAVAITIEPAFEIRELLVTRQIQHRVPGDGRIDLRGDPGVGGNDRIQIYAVAGTCGDLLRVREAVAPDPDLVVRVGQIRHDVTPLIVGHDDLGVKGVEVIGLGDDPDAGLGAVGAGDHATDVVAVQRDLGLRAHRPGKCQQSS